VHKGTRCLNEARDQLNEETVLGLEKELTKWFDFEMKLNGHSSLGRQRTFPEHLLLTTLDQSDDRKWIIQALGSRSALSDAAVQALIGAFQDEDWNVREEAASALGGQSTLSGAAGKALIGAFQDEDWNVRNAAARALRGQSTLSDAAMQALIGACQDEDRNVGLAAASALRDQSTLSNAAIQALIGAFQDEDWEVRSVAAHALGGKSTLSNAAMQALIGALQDEDRNVRKEAARALGGQSTLSDAAMQALIGALQDEDRNVREEAARALRGKSTLSDTAMQALIGALQDEDRNVRLAAARALDLHLERIYTLLPEHSRRSISKEAVDNLNFTSSLIQETLEGFPKLMSLKVERLSIEDVENGGTWAKYGIKTPRLRLQLLYGLDALVTLKTSLCCIWYTQIKKLSRKMCTGCMRIGQNP
ncbi:hypothetical protein FBU30_003862, partial [Linnemannia zychae]